MAVMKRKLGPVGVDKVIDSFQVYLDSLFIGVDWVMYPRVYANPKKENLRSKVPEYFEDLEYYETFMDDNHEMTSFFIVSPERSQKNGILKTKMSLVCQASRLSDLFPTITHRADEEFNDEFVNSFMNYSSSSLDYTGMTTEIQNVYREFDKNEILIDDMNEYYVVRFNFDVNYIHECL